MPPPTQNPHESAPVCLPTLVQDGRSKDRATWRGPSGTPQRAAQRSVYFLHSDGNAAAKSKKFAAGVGKAGVRGSCGSTRSDPSAEPGCGAETALPGRCAAGVV